MQPVSLTNLQSIRIPVMDRSSYFGVIRLVVFATLLSHAYATAPAPPPPPYTTTTECGGVLTLDPSDEGPQGSIEYKLGQPYSNNELCIWTVRAPQSNRI